MSSMPSLNYPGLQVHGVAILYARFSENSTGKIT